MSSAPKIRTNRKRPMGGGQPYPKGVGPILNPIWNFKSRTGWFHISLEAFESVVVLDPWLNTIPSLTRNGMIASHRQMNSSINKLSGWLTGLWIHGRPSSPTHVVKVFLFIEGKAK